jgi:hypothetical protein
MTLAAASAPSGSYTNLAIIIPRPVNIGAVMATTTNEAASNIIFILDVKVPMSIITAIPKKDTRTLFWIVSLHRRAKISARWTAKEILLSAVSSP